MEFKWNYSYNGNDFDNPWVKKFVKKFDATTVEKTRLIIAVHPNVHPYKDLGYLTSMLSQFPICLAHFSVKIACVDGHFYFVLAPGGGNLDIQAYMILHYFEELKT